MSRIQNSPKEGVKKEDQMKVTITKELTEQAHKECTSAKACTEYLSMCLLGKAMQEADNGQKWVISFYLARKINESDHRFLSDRAVEVRNIFDNNHWCASAEAIFNKIEESGPLEFEAFLYTYS